MERTVGLRITLRRSTYRFLSDHQRREGLGSLSAAIEVAVEALQKEVRIAGYRQFAADYAASQEMQEEAAAWLGLPLEAS